AIGLGPGFALDDRHRRPRHYSGWGLRARGRAARHIHICFFCALCRKEAAKRGELRRVSMSGSILVVGSVAFDSVKTPFGEADEILGGSATYFSVASSYFAPVRVVAVVGDDFEDR